MTLISWFNRHLFILLAFVLSISLTMPSRTWAQETEGGGASDGGGGGVIYTTVNGIRRPILIDLYNLTENIELLESKYPGLPSRISQSGNMSIGFDRDNSMRFTSNPALAAVLAITQKWNAPNLKMFGYFFSQILRNPQALWSFTDLQLTVPPFFVPKLLPERSEISPAAYYKQNKDRYTIQLSRPIWNELSLMNQVGLIIHETFRAHQIALSLKFSDEYLQKGTAILLMCEPTEERAQFLRLIMANQGQIGEMALGFDKITTDCNVR